MTEKPSSSSSSSSFEAMEAYVTALEEEKRKIMVFERELPISLQLVTQAIDICRRQLGENHARREEPLMALEPVLEEFMPLRPSNSSSSSSSSDEEERNDCNGGGGGGEADKKPDWLRSVQLWKEPDPPRGDVLKKPIAVSARRVGDSGAFHPFEREKINVKGAATVAPEASSATTETNGGDQQEMEMERQSMQRKSRRCWSPELHRRFLHALQLLGGAHVATPKQIRELMKVDGLTNDEVKSHLQIQERYEMLQFQKEIFLLKLNLQKYRLHTRRPSSGAVQHSSSDNAETPQIVLVGGLWMPPPEYTAATASQQTADTSTGAELNGVYAPVAALLSQHLQKSKQQPKRSPAGPLNSGGRCSGDDNSEDGERTNSDSSTTPSSSQTTTGLPAMSSQM